MMLAVSEGLAEKTALYDYVITNAAVYDGVQVIEQNADVAIQGDKIAEIGKIDPKQARRVIDAKGLVLAPGFIDAHTHADFNPWVYPGLENKIRQGVTTEITGNCGMSAAPVLGEQKKEIHKVWAREGVSLPQGIPWESFEDYKVRWKKTGSLTNHLSLVGHGNLRGAVRGFKPGPASDREIKAMKELLVRSMQEGAAGLSFGLIYLPGVYAGPHEVIELCREVKKFDGVCAFHIRSEGDKLVESIREALEAGRQTGVKIQLSHLKAAGRKNWPKMAEVFRLIEEVRSLGVDVEADAYPYLAGYAELAAAVPPFYYEKQDRLAFFKSKAHHTEIAEKIREYYKDSPDRWTTLAVGAIAGGSFPEYEGKTLQQIADKTKRAPERVLIELLSDTNFEVSAFYFTQSDDVLEQVLLQPFTVVGSDSIADGSTYPHPRAYGTFPRIFSRYVREKNSLVLGRAIRKMTFEPARHFSLQDRGQVRPGFFADLVLFDPQTIQDAADYEHPQQASRGVRWVFVNGEVVLEDGKFNGEKAGRLL